MKSVWKYITGFVSFVIGILVLSNKKSKKVKEIDDAIKDVDCVVFLAEIVGDPSCAAKRSSFPITAKACG